MRVSITSAAEPHSIVQVLERNLLGQNVKATADNSSPAMIGNIAPSMAGLYANKPTKPSKKEHKYKYPIKRIQPCCQRNAGANKAVVRKSKNHLATDAMCISLTASEPNWVNTSPV
jgi:hypothetical protein